jgi:hypothetical protein
MSDDVIRDTFSRDHDSRRLDFSRTSITAYEGKYAVGTLDFEKASKCSIKMPATAFGPKNNRKSLLLPITHASSWRAHVKAEAVAFDGIADVEVVDPVRLEVEMTFP